MKKQISKLMIWNSLSKSKEEFIPLNGHRITWYCCGPTVYDWSHMGHARNYVTTDIIRRILQGYFKYYIIFVQNITDIDDKIILRARHQYFYNTYTKNITEITPEVYNKTLTAWKEFSVSANFPNPPIFEKFKEWSYTIENSGILDSDAKLRTNLTILIRSYEALISYKTLSPIDFLENVKDVLLKHSIDDNTIFREVPAYWESKYNQDMRDLNVLEPSVVVRVSEFIPQIIKFIQGIMKNGSLTQLEEKKASGDFALWKAAKPGEPSWDSPWGKGRPGWHIECSTMATEILGSEIDIHSGGIDLAFPHHDNEIAQSEAFFNNDQWVNYFLHIGHLHIEGQKMSKSLKNFITIQDILKKYTAKQLRLYFLKHQWNLQMDFKENFMMDIKGIEILLNNFFANINALIIEKRSNLGSNEILTYFFSDMEKQLHENFYNAQDSLHDALCDNLNTSMALDIILDLITKTNIYISQLQNNINILIIINISKWISNILEIFGLKDNNFDVIEYDSFNKSTITDHKELIIPYIKTLSTFRDNVRNLSIISRSKSNLELSKDILKLCDKLRDSDLTELGIQLEDRDQGNALIKFIDKNELQQEKKFEELSTKKKLEEQQRYKEKILKGRISPGKLFKTEEYSKWDNQGLPTHDAHGVELTKSKRKKIIKDWKKQTILHEKFLEWSEKNHETI
ncbi:hypothetical protein PCANB_002483 [Pneumocystis canis]|nr:hypothetical protein PCANB_002483 [Pneumocystis canis]